jgi:hypothetical protein
MALPSIFRGKRPSRGVFYRCGRSLEYEDEHSIPVCNLGFALDLAEMDECRTLCALRELITNGALDPYCVSIFDALPFMLRTAPRYVYIDCGSTACNMMNVQLLIDMRKCGRHHPTLSRNDSAGAYPAGVNRLRRLCV